MVPRATTRCMERKRVPDPRVEQSLLESLPEVRPTTRLATVCVIGGYERDYPRNATIRRMFDELGYAVLECHTDAPFPRRHAELAAALLRVRERIDAVWVAEGGHRLVPWIRAVTPRRVPVVFDPFVSRYDTRIVDCRLHSPRSVQAWVARWQDLVRVLGRRPPGVRHPRAPALLLSPLSSAQAVVGVGGGDRRERVLLGGAASSSPGRRVRGAVLRHVHSVARDRDDRAGRSGADRSERPALHPGRGGADPGGDGGSGRLAGDRCGADGRVRAPDRARLEDPIGRRVPGDLRDLGQGGQRGPEQGGAVRCDGQGDREPAVGRDSSATSSTTATSLWCPRGTPRPSPGPWSSSPTTGRCGSGWASRHGMRSSASSPPGRCAPASAGCCSTPGSRRPARGEPGSPLADQNHPVGGLDES